MSKKLIKLLAQNDGKGRPFEIKNMGGEATVYLYDAIGGYWGISAEDFVRELNALEVDTIHLRINSPGGDVFDGRAMQTALSQHKAHVVAHIDGLAASAATFVALGADEVVMSEGAFFMIHKGWTMQVGNADEMRETAALLDKVDASISSDYQRKSGADAEQVEAWMASETWFSAEETVAHGFANSIAESVKVENSFNLEAYANAPKALVEPNQNEETERAKQLLAHNERRLMLVDKD